MWKISLLLFLLVPALVGAQGYPEVITNTGTGNSLTVNDEAGDTSPVVIDADGNMIIGATSTANTFEVLAVGAGRTEGSIVVSTNGDVTLGQLSSTAGENSIITMRSRIGTSIFRTDGSSNFYIGRLDSLVALNTGNVGVLTSTPDEALEVNGNIYLQDDYKSLFGTDKDGAIYYDATNLIVDAQAVGVGHVVLNSAKTTTGDPTGVEGLLYWNTVDNVIKMYADGAWRTLASW